MNQRRLELKIGSPVIAKDGNCGHIQQLVIDPHQEKVIGLIVKRDLLSKHGMIVPLEMVEKSTESEVYLGLDCQQVFSLPKFEEGSPLLLQDQRYRIERDEIVTRSAAGIEVLCTPNSQTPGVEENQHDQERQVHPAFNLQSGYQVLCRGQTVGPVQRLLLDPGGKIRGFVLRPVKKPYRDLIVPIHWIQVVEHKNVHLSKETQALDRLDEYVPDAVLAEKIDHAIWENNALWMTYYSEFHASVKDGVVTLRGHVPTSFDKRTVETTVKSVAGVLGIENQLVADYDLTIAVAQALSRDEHTHLAMISVNSRKGIVSLSGHVECASVQYAAEGIAASIPNVCGVINYIQAPGISIDPAEDRFLQPPIGREVYATDMLLGTVEKVIINPHNRRVMAILIHGNFPDPKNVDSSGWPQEGTFQRRQVILPSRLIDYVTQASASLNIDSLEAAGYADYDAAQYAPPPEDWLPPYPYYKDDILFKIPTRRLHQPDNHSAIAGQITTAEQEFQEMMETWV